ncbi:MAG: succinate dehydrogenase/fumarate reductase, cytochrome b subunit [Planctomycetota bacterium]|nr:succinate dehydrogenase/fumarate reductase, cytochrome b subunit [Planctomycetota bacterium]
MSTSPRPPRYYQPGLIARLVDGFRYGGGLGQWSWLLHRVTGLGILFFLLVHVLDTFLVVVVPEWYDHTVAIYGGIWFDGNYYPALRWAFRFAELGLIASVVFHAVNGVGVILYDFWRQGAHHRREILRGVQVVFWLIMIPTTVAVLYPLSRPPGHMQDIQTDIRPPAASVDRPATTEVALQSPPSSVTTPLRAPRTTGLMFGVMGVAFVWLTVIGFVPPVGVRVRPASGFELRAWYLMRISGLLLVFLAVGHLFIMHILNNVETINYAFIANRWAARRTGFIWRLWDFAMITLALGHGFNGLRQVLFEYIARPTARVLASTLIWLTAISLIGIGSYAIFMFQPDEAYIAKHPMKNQPPGVANPAPPPKAVPAKAENPLPPVAK